METVVLNEFETVQMKYGTLSVKVQDKHLWIWKAEANSVAEFVGLWMETQDWLDENYPDHEVTLYLDPTQPKLLKLFLSREDIQMDFLAVKYIRNDNLGSSKTEEK